MAKKHTRRKQHWQQYIQSRPIPRRDGGLPTTERQAQESESLNAALTYYLSAYLPRLRTLDKTQLKRLIDECSNLSAHYPLHLMQGAQYSLPEWSAQEQTGRQVLAVFVGAFWVWRGEDATKSAALLEGWPCLRDVLALAPCNEPPAGG